MVKGLMQDDFGLTLAHIRRRMADSGGHVTAVDATGSSSTMAYAELDRRVHRLAHALAALGVRSGDRVGTLAWNTREHLELYLAVPSIGAVLHTVNVRLSEAHLHHVITHGGDRVLVVDTSLVPQILPLADRLAGVERFVVIGEDTGALPRAVTYERLLADAPDDDYPFIDPDEHQAAALCYTSGTTGLPKGVLYSHRSVALHASALMGADVLALGHADRVLPVVPMFHVNAWGLPFAAGLAGSDLVLPGPRLQPPALAELIERERPTLMGAVPTVFAALLRHADDHGPDLTSLTKCICGGATVPVSLMRAFEERHGVTIFQAWGMTETSPVCTVARPPAGVEGETAWSYRATQGRAVPWVELRVVDDDDRPIPVGEGRSGELQVRGPWIAAAYFGDEADDDRFSDGWLRTGDVATLSADGYLTITDRTKDVIKSGGEWISSVELEVQLADHPDVVEAAVIAKPDERWDERPLCCVALAPGAAVDAPGLVDHLRSRVPRWWLPDEFAFLDEVPKTGVGKFDKKELRRRLAEGTLAGRLRTDVREGDRHP